MTNKNIIKKQELVTRFFDGYVDDFYSIYDNQSLLSRVTNNLLHAKVISRLIF